MTTKELFLKNKDLADKLNAVVCSDWFNEACVYARAAMLESKVTTEQLDGARMFLDTLSTLAEYERAPQSFPTTGLHHALDKFPKPTEKKQQKQ